MPAGDVLLPEVGEQPIRKRKVRLPVRDEAGEIPDGAVDIERAEVVDLVLGVAAGMNAANEQAVDMFLKRRIGYFGIMETVERVMSRHSPAPPTFEAVLEADAWARREAVE